MISNKSEPKDGDRAPHIGQDGENVIKERILLDGRDDADGDRDQQLADKGHAHQIERRRQALQDHVQRRAAFHVGAAQIPLHHGKEPLEIAAVQGIDADRQVVALVQPVIRSATYSTLTQIALLSLGAIHDGHLGALGQFAGLDSARCRPMRSTLL